MCTEFENINISTKSYKESANNQVEHRRWDVASNIMIKLSTVIKQIDLKIKVL